MGMLRCADVFTPPQGTVEGEDLSAPGMYSRGCLDQLEGLTDIRAVYRKDSKNRWVQKFCRCAVRKLGNGGEEE